MTDSNSKTSSSVPPAANPLATEPISHLIRKYSISHSPDADGELSL